MLILNSRLLHVPIMSLQTGASIAETSACVIDPHQLKVVAFYCAGPRLDVSPAILVADDVREMSNIGIIVDSADVIVSPSDLVRLKPILSINFRLEGKRVVDDSGHKLGKLISYTLDSGSLYVIKIHVQPGFLQALKTTELTIDRTQIIEVSDTEVVVKSAKIKHESRDEKMASAPVLENPFRQAPVNSADRGSDE